VRRDYFLLGILIEARIDLPDMLGEIEAWAVDLRATEKISAAILRILLGH